MASYTSVSDVSAQLGRPIIPPESEQVQAWIDRVELRIRGRVPNLDELATTPTYLSALKGVVVDVVIRKIHNPQGMRSERIDDYYYDRGSTSADLWPTDAEWAELIPDVMRGAFSVRPGFTPDTGGAAW